MKKIVLYIAFTLTLAINQANAQGVTAGINPLTLPCGGGQVNLTALGNSTTPVFGDNFNNGGLQPGWSTNVTADFTNPCGASVDGTTYLWMGSSAAAPRAISSAPVDVSCGGTVCFDFKYVCESCGDAAPCEGADLYDEGVGLQYSVDGGATWTTFQYFAPNGNILGNVPNTSWPSASGTTPFTSWNNFCFTIPAGALSPTTLFRMRQFNSSGNQWDHWGIDNFFVFANPCNPFYYDWEQIPGAPDPADVTANVTQTTTFTVHYTDGTIDYTDQVTVVVSSISILNVNITPEACLGDDNASITTTVDVSGGTAPFTYNLTGPTTGSNSTGSFSGLSPGLYTLTLTDGGGCSDTYNFTINPGPPCCSVTATGSDPSCNGGTDGTATANPANGQPPYTYAWNNGQTTQTATGLTAGNYSVTITDAGGCTSSANVTLSEPTVITASTTPTNVSCFNGADGQILVNAPSGGTPGYTYSINGGAFQAGSTFTGLNAGNYTIAVKDNNGCTITLTQSITQPTDVTLSETNNVSATCGMSNGQTTVLASGGTGSYTYDLSGTTNATGNFTGLASGNYVITATDGNGCTETINITIGNSPGPVPAVDASSAVTCAGGFNGSVSVSVTNGQSPYTYSLDGGTAQSSNTFTLPAGSHTITVTDFNGCTGNVNFNITEPSPLTYTTAITPTTCNGDCDGQITINASGSNGGYTYSVDGGPFLGASTITGLCAGNHNIVVQDVNGCSSNSTENVTEPAVVNSNFTFVEPSCFGICDAEIHLNGTTGGDGNYTYSVDNGTTFQASPDFFGQCAGSFDIIIQDGNGCQGILNGSVVTTPPQITFNFVANNPSNCGAQDGSFIITAQNGTSPYNYFVHTQPGSTNPYTSGVQGNGNFTNLYAGLYTLVVTDDDGCSDSTFSALSDLDMTSTLQFSQDLTCYNSDDGVGVVTVVTGGVAPITYVLNTFVTGNQVGPQANGTFTSLPAGDHTITITDNGLCINIIQFTLTEPDTIQFNATATDVSCPSNATNIVNDGTITFSNAVGGANTTYEYSIDGGVTYQASTNFTGLAPGTYTLFVRDPNGCEGQSTIDINQPTDFSVVTQITDLTCNNDNTGFMQIFASGGTSNYTYDVNGTSNATGIFAGLAANPSYNITITDNTMCTFSAIAAVNEPPALTANYIVTDVTCNGLCNGEVLITANGGTPNYLYSPDGGITYQAGNNITGLCAGNHQISVKDDHDCVVDANQVVNEPTLITFNMTSTPATCGNDNGTITINANNGTPSYQYSASSDNGLTFTPLQVATTITNLPAGNTIVMVTDSYSCEVTQTETIISEDSPIITNHSTTDVLCNGLLTGEITFTATGGTGTLSYDIGGASQATGTFIGIAAGNYTLTVTDQNNCTDALNVTITEPAPLSHTEITQNLNCFQDNSGYAEINVDAVNVGTAPYVYSFDGGISFVNSNIADYLAAGNHTLIVEDFYGCQSTSNIVLTEPNILTAQPLNSTDVNCFGGNDGSATVDVTGGTTPYNYVWSDGTVNGVGDGVTNLYAGGYIVDVTDFNGCTAQTSFIINEPPMLVINSVSGVDFTCNGLCDGEINILSPFATQFSVDNGSTFQAGNSFTGLCPTSAVTTFNIVVQDANGCTQATTIDLIEPSLLVLDPISPISICYDGYGTLEAFANGGTQPYYYVWDATDTVQYLNVNVTVPTDFSCTVYDAHGCPSNTENGHVDIIAPPFQASLTQSATSICPGDNITITGSGVDGVPSYNYYWVTTTYDTLDFNSPYVFTPPSTPGDYTIYMIGYDQCYRLDTLPVNVTVNETPVPSFEINPAIGCTPLNVEFVNTTNVDTSTATLIWTFGDGNSYQGASNISNLYTESGCYDVSLEITTAEGCYGNTTYNDTVCLYDDPIPGFYWNPSQPTVLNSSIQIIDLSENAVSYYYNFNNQGNSDEENPHYTFEGITSQTSVQVCQTVTSEEGCSADTCQMITIYDELIFYVPNVFTPDHDDFNEVFKPVFTSGFDIYDYHLTIFNRWGEIVFESYNAQVGWDGTYGGELCADGVYVWQINFGELISDKKQNIRGHVSLLK